MIWQDWSEDTRAQAANGLATLFLLVLGVVTWHEGNRLWAGICALGVAINLVGAGWMLRRSRRRR